MAITNMKRFRILTLRREADSLISSLRSLRCADIEKTLPPPDEDVGQAFEEYDVSRDLSAVKAKISETTAALDFLALYAKKSRGLFRPLPEASEREAALPPPDDPRYEAVKHVLAIRDEKSRLSSEKTALENEVESLLPWEEFEGSIPRSKTSATESVVVSMSAKVPVDKTEDLLDGLAAVVETVRTVSAYRFVMLTAYRSDFDEALARLSRIGFSPAACEADEGSGYAAGKIAESKKKIEEISSRIEEIDKEAERLSEDVSPIELLHDSLISEEERLGAVSKVAASDRCAVLCGWIPEPAVGKVTALLESRGDAYEFTEPEEDDDPPILLSNNRFTRSFEPVIELYSLPKYGSFDPTSIMSIFYIIIFGLMLADVGYGVLISLGCFLGIKLMKPKKSTRNMLMMFGKCGISCIVAGILFGGYFGDAPAVIADRWFSKPLGELAVWFNPLTNFTTFLAVSLAIGAVHLICGLALKFYVTWKRGHRLDAIFDSGSWIILFLGAGIALFFRTVGLILVGIGLLLLITTQGRHSKNPIMKIFGGFASLYDIVGYISDLLSYSRILALGLASMVIASVFNILGTMPGPSVGGVIFFVVIFLIGHLLNMAINMLGTFVHTSRLQYIEFFGKFYEDGGRPFEPLTSKSKYVTFK